MNDVWAAKQSVPRVKRLNDRYHKQHFDSSKLNEGLQSFEALGYEVPSLVSEIWENEVGQVESSFEGSVSVSTLDSGSVSTLENEDSSSSYGLRGFCIGTSFI